MIKQFNNKKNAIAIRFFFERQIYLIPTIKLIAIRDERLSIGERYRGIGSRICIEFNFLSISLIVDYLYKLKKR